MLFKKPEKEQNNVKSAFKRFSGNNDAQPIMHQDAKSLNNESFAEYEEASLKQIQDSGVY